MEGGGGGGGGGERGRGRLEQQHLLPTHVLMMSNCLTIVSFPHAGPHITLH